MAKDQVCKNGLNSDLGAKYPSEDRTSAKLLKPKNALNAVRLFSELSHDDGMNKLDTIVVITIQVNTAGNIRNNLFL